MADVPVSIEITGDGSDATRELKEVNRTLNKTNKEQEKGVGISKTLLSLRKKLLGVGIALAALEIGRRFTAHVKAIDKFSQSVRVSAEQAQKLAFAAKRTGIELSDVEASILNLARESGSRNNTFRILGVDFKTLQSLSPAQLFDEIGRKIQAGNMNALQMSVAIKLLGSSGTKTFKALSNGFNEFAAEAEESGAVIKEDVFNAVVMSATEVKTALIQAAEAIAKELLPGFESFGLEAVKWMDRLTDSIDMMIASMVYLKTLASGVWNGKGVSESMDIAQKTGREKLVGLETQRDVMIGSSRVDTGGISNDQIQGNLGGGDYIKDLAGGLAGREPVDDLARTGLFATQGASAATSQQARQVGLLGKIAANTSKIISTTKNA